MRSQTAVLHLTVLILACTGLSVGALLLADRSAGLSLSLIVSWPFLAFVACRGRFAGSLNAVSPHSRNRTQQLAGVYQAITEALASAISAKESYTHHSVRRVQDICSLLCRRLGLDADTTEGVEIAALVRDAGKLGVPDYILLKPGPLDPEEFRRMTNHAAIGATILENVQQPWNVAGIVKHHHERYDGTGYPDRLQGEQIPIGARVVALADVYDALISDRCYREGWTHQEAAAHIEQLSGTQFDPAVVRAFLEVEQEVGEWAAPHESGSRTESQSCAAADCIAQANRELVSLFEIAQTLARTLEIEEAASILAHRTGRLLQAGTCVVFTVDDKNPDVLVAKAAAGRGCETLKGATVGMGTGITGSAAARRQVFAGPYDSSDMLLPRGATRQLDFRFCAVAPVVSCGELLGTVNLYNSCEQEFSAEDLRVLAFVAHQAALAIQNARTFEQVRDAATRDPLTDLHNGRHLREYLEREISRCARLEQPLSVLGIDFDNFKAVNDTMGHQAGDAVLKEMADILRSHLRDYDLAVRVGGDEFVVVLPGTPECEALRTAERIGREIDQFAEQRMGLQTGTFGASVGIACYPDDAGDPESLLARADASMYRSKRARRQGRLAA